MFNNRKDDDVIVISEEDVTYETPEESDDTADSAAPAAGDELAADDLSSRPESDATGRFDTVTMPGDAAATPDTDTDTPETATGAPAADADSVFAAGRDSSFTDPASADSFTDPAAADDPAAPVTSAGTYGDRDADDTETAADDTGSAGDALPATASGTVNGTGHGPAIPMPGAAPDATAAPVAASAPPVAAPAAPADPAAASATPADTATPVGSATPADSNWPQIQALFVDDPLSAVRQAADVAGGALAALVAAANNREQTMRDSWQSDTIGTEDLRTALRSYRDLAARMSELSKNF